MGKPDNWIVDSAEDAAETAWGMGYRPCVECGTWLLPRQMNKGTDAETGEECYFCAVCSARQNHLLEVG